MNVLFRASAVGLILAGMAAGCGSSATEVAGKVSYQGKALPAGSVTLVGSSGAVYTGDIQPDGTYRIPQVPTGSVKIAVVGGRGNVRKPSGARGEVGARPTPEAPAPAHPAAPTLPDQYANPETSGLSGTVTSGKPLDISIP